MGNHPHRGQALGGPGCNLDVTAVLQGIVDAIFVFEWQHLQVFHQNPL